MDGIGKTGSYDSKKIKEYDAIHELYQTISTRYEAYHQEADGIRIQLDDFDSRQNSIVIKTIQGKKYYYEQWRENGKLKYRSLGRVEPGNLAELEIQMLKKEELQSRYRVLQFLMEQLEQDMQELRKEMNRHIIPDNYFFEVFWKNELSARVAVKNDRVHVSRFIDHPIRQLFSGEVISRNQLNQILRLRCFDEHRADCSEKLHALGLREYNPLEIVKITHGVTYNDYLWFRFPGEKLSASDVLVR